MAHIEGIGWDLLDSPKPWMIKTCKELQHKVNVHIKASQIPEKFKLSTGGSQPCLWNADL